MSAFLSYLAGIDYVAVTGQEIVFNSTFTMTSVPVQIIDDELFELVERFNGLLSSSALPPNVMLSPSLATASILEESGNIYSIIQTIIDSTTYHVMVVIEIQEFINKNIVH